MIQCCHLKKDADETRFLQFRDDAGGVLLTVSGVGEIAAAAAVSSVCARYAPGPVDFLLNVGICAGTGGQDGLFLINKITEQASGRTYYPDILYRHPFREERLVTSMAPVMAGNACGALYDMEAAVYQAGAYFFGPHQMWFLKIVSDYGIAPDVPDRQAVSRQRVEWLMERYAGDVLAFIRNLADIAQQGSFAPGGKHVWQRERAEPLVQKLARDMHASKAMESAIRNQVHYLAVAGVDYEALARQMYEAGALPCRDKKAGKKVFEQWKRCW